MTNTGDQAEPGWYDDPHAPGRMRYFDGETWTNHFHDPETLPDIGSWLTATFGVFGAHWKGAAAIALSTSLIANFLAWIPIRFIIDDLAVVDNDLVNFTSSTALSLLVVFVAVFIWQGFGWLALNRYMQRAHYQAQPSVLEAFVRAVQRLPKYIGVLVLMLVGAMLVLFLIGVLMLASPTLGVLVVLGALVAGVYVSVKLTFICAAISAGPADAPPIATSASVSTGRFWSILLRLLMFTIGLTIAGSLISIPFGDLASGVDQDAASGIVEFGDDEIIVNDFRIKDLLPSAGKLIPMLIITSVLRAGSSMLSTSAYMRLYLDSGAPSEI